MEERHGVPFIDPCVRVIPRAAIEMLPAELAWQHNVAPLAVSGRTLTVAVENPFDFELIDKLRFCCEMPIHVVMADQDRIAAVVSWHYGNPPDR